MIFGQPCFAVTAFSAFPSGGAPQEDGPWCVASSGVYGAGAVRHSVHVVGLAAADVFSPGAVRTE